MKLLEFQNLSRPSFASDWFHGLLAEYAEACVLGDSAVPNLLVSLPPGSGKTELLGIQLPAWNIAHEPLTAHCVSISNADNLARMACGNVLRILENPTVAERFPLEFDKRTESQFQIAGNDGRPSMLAAGIMSQVTGARATLLTFDDCIKNLEVAYSEEQTDKIYENFRAVCETRLLPNGRIVGVGTRFCLRDLHQRLLDQAVANSDGRSYVYINLACWNRGEDSYIYDTRTDSKRSLPKYDALARVKGAPYSFSAKDFRGKRADLGPDLFAAVYLGSPTATTAALFPSESWSTVDDNIKTDELNLIVTAWDMANKTGSSNDYSANCVVGQFSDGRYVVLDVWKSKVDFSQLPQIVAERYKAIYKRYRNLPLLAIEDTAAGTQAIQLIRATHPEVPLVAAKTGGKSKVIRAQGVTPLTRAGLVALPRNAIWREAFVSELAQFPVGKNDDVVDAFVIALKAFYAEDEFRNDPFLLMPGRRAPNGVDPDEMKEQLIGAALDGDLPDFEIW
jgi:predicted phage terminase large subunit-like protein